MKHSAIELLSSQHIWKGTSSQPNTAAYTPSGFTNIDSQIEGWPLGNLIEIIPQQTGIGELSILLPSLAHISQNQQWILFAGPPHIPYAPGLAGLGIDISKIIVTQTNSLLDTGWCMEQALKSGTLGAVIGWLPKINDQLIRRLQLTLDAQKVLCAFFTKPSKTEKSNPTPWRIIVRRKNRKTLIDIRKRRGGGPINAIHIHDLLSKTCCGFA